jgi:hypothetical protein
MLLGNLLPRFYNLPLLYFGFLTAMLFFYGQRKLTRMHQTGPCETYDLIEPLEVVYFSFVIQKLPQRKMNPFSRGILILHTWF